MSWTVSVQRGSVAELHARPLPDVVSREVWICEPTDTALVLGSAQRDDVVDRAASAAGGVEVVRRRSGGGAVLVEPGRMLWVDVLVPAVDELWQDDVGHAFLWLGEIWAEAFADVGVAAAVHRGPLVRTGWSDLVCFAGLGPGELTDPSGRKLLGISQRRTRAGARFQCTVGSAWDPDRLLGLLALPAADRRVASVDLRDAGAGVARLDELLQALLSRLP